ncbi:MAG TPA: hypothetical protein P5551_11655 [Syntrophales bacterium]|nr:hypothetical protein [Syntrophales bacterium]
MTNTVRILIVAALAAALAAGPAIATETSPTGTLERYLQKAKQDYLQKDVKAASEEMHKAAEWMKSEAAAAKGKGKEALAASGREIEKLSVELKKEAVKSVKEIEMVSARAYQALATNSHVKSAEAWSKKEFKKAGEELEATADALGKAYTWAGQEVKAGTQEAIRESKQLSERLKEGSGRASAEAERTLKKMEQEIRAFGRGIAKQSS